MKKRDFVIVLGSLLILTILWVLFTIYHNLTTSTIKDPLTIQIIPISGKFDTKTLEALKKRDQINPEYQIKASPAPSPSPEETVTLTPEVSQEEATLSAQEASDSGDLFLEGQ